MSRYLRLLAVVLIVLIATLPISYALSIGNITVSGITDSSAKIGWDTDVISNSIVDYGINSSLGLESTSNNLVKKHEVTLTGLNESTSYMYKLTSAAGINVVTDDNNGNLHQFTTQKDSPPQIQVTIPRFYNSKSIDLVIGTDPNSLVDIYVNGILKKRARSAANGNATITGIPLGEGNNTIKINVEDPRKQTAEEEQDIFVDSAAPVMTLQPIPSLLIDNNLIINGTVSEESDITITWKFTSGDNTPPQKVTGLHSTTVDDNSVELAWNKSNEGDFSEYAVYRNGAQLASRTGNNFADQVNTSSSYTYSVSALDDDCNEGPLSDSVSVTTLAGKKNISASSGSIRLSCGSSKTTRLKDVSGNFTAKLSLKTDGYYNLSIIAADKANNSAIVRQTIFLNTQPPEFKDISPKEGTRIFEQFADEVDITGKTDPNTKLFLYVKRTPLGDWNGTFDDKIKKVIDTIEEADLSVNAKGQSRADYETMSDISGNFNFPNVDVTSSIAAGLNFKQIDYTELEDTGTSYDRDQTLDSNLLFIGQDSFGRRGYEDVSYKVQTCWSGDRLWDATPLLQYQSPAFISTERLAEGTETLYFYFNFTYFGSEKDEKPIINDIDIQRACDDTVKDDPKYAHSCKVMKASVTKAKVLGGRTAYVVYRLNRYQEMDNWTTDDWDSFYDSLKESEMVFPLKFTLKYKFMNQSGREERGTQTFCDSVGYFVDRSRVDPRSVLPDWLLYDFVDILDSIIETTTKWMEKLEDVLRFAAIACMSAFFTKFLMKFSKNFSCRLEGLTKLTAVVGLGSTETKECKQCLQDFDHFPPDVKLSSLDMNDLSDTCLQECYPSCASGWDREETFYNFFRWSCDRVFGHTAPAGWTQTVSSDDLLEKAQMGSQCTEDQSTLGQPLVAINCRSVEAKYGIKGEFGVTDECVEITKAENGKKQDSLYLVGAHQGSKVYELTLKKGPRQAETIYAIQQTSKRYLTAQEDTCSNICAGNTQKGAKKTEYTIEKDIDADGNEFDVIKPKKQTEKKEVALGMCITPNECQSFIGKKLEFKDGAKEVKTAVQRGYTNGCFYETGDDFSVVSGDPSQRLECCCLSADKDISYEKYYLPIDVEAKDSPAFGEGAQHASEQSSAFTPEDWKNMDWSYRYSQIKWQVPPSKQQGTVRDQYDPRRYISERDQSACFGQNNWLFDGFSTEPKYTEDEEGNKVLANKELMLDPAKDHLAAFQCASISGINSRLGFIRNLATSMKSCLIQVRETGEADSGVCKEIFTQYVCSLVWEVISWVNSGCSPLGSLEDTKEDGWSKYIVAGTGAMLDSVRESQNELAAEYGNADLTNLFGMGEESVVRNVCLAAFGYDWDISVESFMDAAYATPFATFVQSVLPGREYLTFDPTNGQSYYEYKTSWLINPGCNFDDYDVYLSCVGRNQIDNHDDVRCDKVGSQFGGNCDCSSQDEEHLRKLYDGGELEQNVLENIDHTTLPSNNRIILDRYRYDHLKIVIDGRNIARSGGDVDKCFPDGHLESGTKGVFYFPIKDYTPPNLAACSVDPLSGVFDCSVGANFVYPFGQAHISEVKLGFNAALDANALAQLSDPTTVKPTFYENERVKGTITYDKDSTTQCLVLRLMDKTNKKIIEAEAPITLQDQGASTVSFSFDRQLNNNNFKKAADGADLTPVGSVYLDFGNTKDAALYAHVDMRQPDSNGNCFGIEGIGYDSSNIVAYQSAPQSFDIPIYLLPGKRGDVCGTGQLGTIDNSCVCTDGTSAPSTAVKDCPDNSKEYSYCAYGLCRKYPACDTGKATAVPCVCGNAYTDLNTYNCGYTENAPYNADFAGDAGKDKPEFKYCVQASGSYVCQNSATGSSGTTAASKPTVSFVKMNGQVTADPSVTISKGTDVTITFDIQDDSGISSIGLLLDSSLYPVYPTTDLVHIRSGSPDPLNYEAGKPLTYTVVLDTNGLANYNTQLTVQVQVIDDSGEVATTAAAPQLVVTNV
ncbi:MAG TPA: hypothetical protein VJH97_06390 [Candidatus Nanoarchaeia archaeon]|nr:hypothetical protein [Candidatus Nanoarchaeia archaeon]